MRVSKPPHERKAELLAAARTLFDLQGVENTRVSDIVGRVGVSQGIFYYYFKSKDSIVEEVVRKVGQEMEAAAGAILKDDSRDFYAKLSGLIELYIGLVDQFLGDNETSLSADSWGKSGSSITGRCAAALDEKLRVLVLEGKARGVVAAEYPWEAAQVVLFGLRQLAQERLPTRRQIYAIVEGALGLPRGRLTKKCEQYCSKEKGPLSRGPG